MKTLLTILITISIISFNSQAQYFKGKIDKQRHEQLKAQKIAFITTKLDLSVEQSQQFWAVYNEFDNKLHAIHDERYGIMQNFHRDDDKTLTDEKLEELTDRLVDIELEEAHLKKEYYLKNHSSILFNWLYTRSNSNQ